MEKRILNGFCFTILTIFSVGYSHGATVWTDWTSFSNPSGASVAYGALGNTGISVSIEGTGGSAQVYAPNSIITNTYNWSGTAYTPNLSNSDFLYLHNTVANSQDTWTINFSNPVENPVALGAVL